MVWPIREGGQPGRKPGSGGSVLPQGMLDALAERMGVAMPKRTRHASRWRRNWPALRDLKSAVLDALAHEIRSPLNTVKVSVSTLLSAHPGTQPQQRELLTIIGEEVDRMNRWIDDAVQISAREASQIQLHKTLASVRAVVMRALDEQGLALAGRKIDVAVDESLPLAALRPGNYRKGDLATVGQCEQVFSPQFPNSHFGGV